MENGKFNFVLEFYDIDIAAKEPINACRRTVEEK